MCLTTYTLLQPDNVLIDDRGTAKLSDFGTVRKNRSVGEDLMNLNTASHLKTQNVIGTPFFMPPEYLQSGRISAKTDAYGFGIFIMLMLTNKQLTPQVRVFLCVMQFV